MQLTSHRLSVSENTYRADFVKHSSIGQEQMSISSALLFLFAVKVNNTIFTLKA